MVYRSKHWHVLGLLAAAVPAMVVHADSPAVAPAAAEDHTFAYHTPDVLGTSLDLKIVAPTQTEADACEQTLLHEIERLRTILSTYDPQSEISKFQANAPAGFVNVSDELHAVLLAYQTWRTTSGGAYSAQLGDLISIWGAAEKKGAIPTDEELAPVIAKLKEKAFLTSAASNGVKRLTDQKLNIDSYGKGYIVQRAAGFAKLKHPTITGILLNIGGDIRALGFSTPPSAGPGKPWLVRVADPDNPADNAVALTTLKLTNSAVATSGAYERTYTFGDKTFSHILNPITGKPSDNDILSATAIASDAAVANALATTLCILPEAEGLKLVEKTPGAAALLVTRDGRQVRSKLLAGFEVDPPAAPAPPVTDAKPPDPKSPDSKPPDSKPAAGAAWPKGFGVAMDVSLLPAKRQPNDVPYTIVWVEDSAGKCTKVLAAWIGRGKYMARMNTFSKQLASATDFAAVTRPTRRVGRYTLTWDGTDAANKPVVAGDYNIWIEVAFDHGGHAAQKTKITCGTDKSSAVIPPSTAWDKIPVIYGPTK